VCLAAAAACGAIAVTAHERAAAVQQALRDLRTGRHQAAEDRAFALANDSDAPAPRAWVIVAEARRRQGKYDSAMQAYRQFLASCNATGVRAYVTAHLRTCRAATENTAPRGAPSKRMTAEELAEMARIDDRVHVESSEHFVVRARNARLAKVMAFEAEASLDRICHAVLAEQEYAHAVDIYVWTDRQDYRAHAPDSPEWSGGTFRIIFRSGKVVRRIDLTQCDADGRFAAVTLDRILPHEMCHLVLEERFGQTGCPLFLNEGLAMLSEWEVDNERVILAGTALAGESRIPLDRLFARERHDIGDPAVFYAESFSFTEYLHGRLSEQQFKAFLGHIKDGCTVRDALQRALYLPPDSRFMGELASAWEEHAVAQAQIVQALRGADGGAE